LWINSAYQYAKTEYLREEDDLQNKGHVMLHRQIMDSKIWSVPDSIYKMFTYLIMKANHKTVTRGTNVYNRGEHRTSYENMVKELGMSTKTIARNLKWLADEEYIDILSGHREATLVRIRNYDYYQKTKRK
jgi:hypothetical protein